MISADLATFLSGRVDIQMGTRDADLRPHSSRVSALRVEPDGNHVVAFVPAAGADLVRRDLEANGHAAMAVSCPPDARTYQLKGTCVDIRPARDEDRPFVQQFWDSFLGSLVDIGIDHKTFSHWPVWPSLAIRIRVTNVFSQTPGPGAGAPVA